MPTTDELISAIRSRDAVDITKTFNAIMSERIADVVDAHRNTLVASLFNKEDDGQEAA